MYGCCGELKMNCCLRHPPGGSELLFEFLGTFLWLFRKGGTLSDSCCLSVDGHLVFHGRSRTWNHREKKMLYDSTAMVGSLSNHCTLRSRSGVTLNHTDGMGCTSTRQRIFARSVANKEGLLSTDNNPSPPNISTARSMKSNSAIIAGATFGTCLVLLSLVVLFVLVRRRRLRAREIFISPYSVDNPPGSGEIITLSPPTSPKTARFFGSNTSSSSKSKRYQWPRSLPPRPDKSPSSNHLATSRDSSPSSIPTERLLKDIVPDMDPALSPAAIIPPHRPSSPTGSLVVVINGREPIRKKPILPR